MKPIATASAGQWHAEVAALGFTDATARVIAAGTAAYLPVGTAGARDAVIAGETVLVRIIITTSTARRHASVLARHVSRLTSRQYVEQIRLSEALWQTRACSWCSSQGDWRNEEDKSLCAHRSF